MKLTQKMEEILMDCHEREILNLEPRSAYYIRSCKLLLQEELIAPKKYLKDGKEVYGLFITSKGIQYLKAIVKPVEVFITLPE